MVTLDAVASPALATTLDADAAWRALAGVPDPEIPVVSVVELGIVRSVEVDGDSVAVRVTPTYSGCPATAVILADIATALRAAGFVQVAVDVALAPAWTTDWIGPEARRKLAAFGIAPPHAAPTRIDVSGLRPRRRAEAIACPRCGSAQTSLVAAFSSTACKALYRCDACREPFDYFKPH
jgi:ring-1,2-phenylacetyl-CoA epoxidase subunit PaaD